MNQSSDHEAQPPRVLIVEDEPHLRQLLGQMLVELDYRASAVASGEQALHLMADDPHDIALLDLNLPGMTGLECLERLRGEHPDLPAIILTGFGDLDAAQHAIRLGVSDFLTKPTRMGDLEAALARARRALLSDAPADATPEAWAGSTQPASTDEADDDRPMALKDLERRHILAALERHEGNRARAAAELGISLRTLYYRLSEYQKQGYLDANDL